MSSSNVTLILTSCFLLCILKNHFTQVNEKRQAACYRLLHLTCSTSHCTDTTRLPTVVQLSLTREQYFGRCETSGNEDAPYGTGKRVTLDHMIR